MDQCWFDPSLDCRCNSWNHFGCNIDEKIVRKTSMWCDYHLIVFLRNYWSFIRFFGLEVSCKAAFPIEIKHFQFN
jgi:hypothetical protein